jgi:RecA-family ATPase
MTGAGKTAIALLLAIIASNRNQRGKFGPHEVERIRVVYVACENATDVRTRIIGMLDKLDLNRADLDLLVIDKVFDIEKNMDRIREEATAFGDVGLIIIDTSAAMFQGNDENDNPLMLKHAKLQRQLCGLPGINMPIPARA